MKILFFHSVPDVYGASRSLLRLTAQLSEGGHQILVVLPGDGPLSCLLKRAGVNVTYVPELMIIERERSPQFFGGLARKVRSCPASIIRVARIVKSFRPDCIHTNTSLIVAPALVAKWKRIPHVWHVREIFSDFPKLWVFYQWFMYFFSDVIICVSQAVAAQFNPVIRKRAVEVIYNGFPRREFENVSNERVRAFRDRFGLNGHVLVGLVGRIKIGRKGQDVFVRSAALLKKEFPEVRFLCIGSPFPGNECHLDRLMQIVGEVGLRDVFVYTGDVEDVKAAYASLHVSVVPSVLPESFSGVVIESMAMGKPVVGSSIGGTVEQIDDGVTGFLVPPGDSEALARKLAVLLSRRELIELTGEHGRQKFLNEFEFTPFYERLSAVYSRLLGNEND